MVTANLILDMKHLLLIPVLFVLVGCNNPDNWTAFYYPQKDDLSIYTKQSGLIDFEACRDYIWNLSEERDADGEYDYECGKNCELDLALETYICEETIK